MTTTEEFGAALSRSFGPCWHHVAAPVVLVTGEVVASVCESCWARLPASWGCEDCEYAEIHAYGWSQPMRVMTAPCELHRA